MTIHLQEVPPDPGAGYGLALHGGAGRTAPVDSERARAFRAGLLRALRAGRDVLAAGAAAEDAVVAAVRVLEDDPLFNCARGAVLTRDGGVELDAALMSGDGRAGAVACARHARNPVLAARAVRDRTPHVLVVDPGPDLLDAWGIETASPEYFVTPDRLLQARAARGERLPGAPAPTRHGTVGAVARDRSGHVAAATSTGGVGGQLPGRVGDTPLIGAGTYARDGGAAVSCTGVGEYFVRGVVAHDVVSRMRYAGRPLSRAVRETIQEALEDRGTGGGLVAVDAAGGAVLAWNAAHMFRGWIQAGAAHAEV